MNKRVKLLLGVLTIFSVCLILQYNTLLFQYKMEPSVDTKKENKTILYWTPMFDRLDFYFGEGSEMFQNCTYKNCYATHRDLSLQWLKFPWVQEPWIDFDAILFHGMEYRQDYFGKPRDRRSDQVYVFSNQESPVYTESLALFDNFYNWTMTYRLDSEIIRSYGSVKRKETTYSPPTVEEIIKRPKKIAWLVSNCDTPSLRHILQQNIAKYIPIDVYGKCGSLSCPKKKTRECYSMIENDYKFYLSFENSVCKDYVTEKLYNALQLNVVPIVYGGANYDRVAPPNSVIDVTKFETIEKLVEHIKFLDRHPEEYLKYFEWKKHYVVDTSNSLALCTLCAKLHNPLKLTVYSDIDLYWRGNNDTMCATNEQLLKMVYSDPKDEVRPTYNTTNLQMSKLYEILRNITLK